MVHTVSQILTMVTLVAAGRGIAFVPETAKLLGVEGVAFLPLDGICGGRRGVARDLEPGCPESALAKLAQIVRGAMQA